MGAKLEIRSEGTRIAHKTKNTKHNTTHTSSSSNSRDRSLSLRSVEQSSYFIEVLYMMCYEEVTHHAFEVC